MNLKRLFLEYCKNNQFEINLDQLDIIAELKTFYKDNFKQSFLNKIFKKNYKIGFYLVGDVGVGKTMILDFFYERVKDKKSKFHFNEFMLDFHDFAHKIKDIKDTNKINKFVKKTQETKKKINPKSKKDKIEYNIKKGSEMIKYQTKPRLTFVNLLSYTLVSIISFTAIIIFLDTFKSPLYSHFPDLEFLLFNLYETIEDIKLFISDLV